MAGRERASDPAAGFSAFRPLVLQGDMALEAATSHMRFAGLPMRLRNFTQLCTQAGDVDGSGDCYARGLAFGAAFDLVDSGGAAGNCGNSCSVRRLGK